MLSVGYLIYFKKDETYLRATDSYLPHSRDRTCHQIHANSPHFTLMQTGRYSIYLPADGLKAE